jgi:archaellin
LQILSRTGIVQDSTNEADTQAIVLGAPDDGNIVVDNGDQLSADTATDNGVSTLSGSATAGELTVNDGETIEFTRNGSSVTITNIASGSSVTIGASESITVSDEASDGTEAFTLNYDNTKGTTQSIDVDEGGDDIGIELFTRTETFLQIDVDESSNIDSLVANDSSTVTVVDDGDTSDGSSDGIALTGGGSSAGELAVQGGDELTFELSTNPQEVTITNSRTGSSIAVDPSNGIVTPEGGESVKLSDGLSVTDDVILDDGQSNGDDTRVFTRPITDGTAITEIQLVIGRGAGSDDIDMSGTVISMRAPDGSFTLTYAPGGAFGLNSVKDDDNTLPVLSSGDRFELVIDPGKIQAGETIELTITTSSGAKRVLQLRVPDSLANEQAVGL